MAGTVLRGMGVIAQHSKSLPSLSPEKGGNVAAAQLTSGTAGPEGRVCNSQTQALSTSPSMPSVPAPGPRLPPQQQWGLVAHFILEKSSP